MKYFLYLLILLFIHTNVFSDSKNKITDLKYQSILDNVKKAEQSLEEFTVEQEYYLGRAVAATILSKYSVLDNIEANLYINKLGIGLAALTPEPLTFGGYHFQILDTDEINAFATPSGHVFISKGLIQLTQSEDELAAILAHEISHILLKHGTAAIDKSRISTFYNDVVHDNVKDLSLKKSMVSDFFKDSIREMTATFINTGYSKEFEYKADKMAGSIIRVSGYNKYALILVLSRMNQVIKDTDGGFAVTHPNPIQRIQNIRIESGLKGYGDVLEKRERYSVFMNLID